MTGDSWMSEVGRGLLAGAGTHWVAAFYFISQVSVPILSSVTRITQSPKTITRPHQFTLDKG